MFPEALLLHLIDNMDSKMECMRSLIDRDQQVQGEWTAYSSPLDRAALKKRKYLEASPGSVAGAPQAKAASPLPEPASAFADKLRGALGSTS
jgi:3'-5' exoribonuclease